MKGAEKTFAYAAIEAKPRNVGTIQVPCGKPEPGSLLWMAACVRFGKSRFFVCLLKS